MIWKIVISMVVVLVGSTIPHFLISDGLDRFTGEKRIAAQHALSLARGCRDHPIERGLTPHLQVIEVHSEPGYCPVLGGPAFRAVVQTYGLFPIPTGTISVECGSTDCAQR